MQRQAVPLVKAEAPFVGNFAGDTEAVDWALLWLPEGGELLTESYVNLIPTMQGGTHVNGLRQGLLDAMREFCEYRNILPRGVKLSKKGVTRVTYRVVSVDGAEVSPTAELVGGSVLHPGALVGDGARLDTAIGVKTIAAYRIGLDFDPTPPDRPAVEAAVCAWMEPSADPAAPVLQAQHAGAVGLGEDLRRGVLGVTHVHAGHGHPGHSGTDDGD